VVSIYGICFAVIRAHDLKLCRLCKASGGLSRKVLRTSAGLIQFLPKEIWVFIISKSDPVFGTFEVLKLTQELSRYIYYISSITRIYNSNQQVRNSEMGRECNTYNEEKGYMWEFGGKTERRETAWMTKT
jgi:hypothetical protein